jgi:hypothetical protein
MEKVEIQAETSSPTAVKERTDIVTPGECPTCVSGFDPSIGGSLFQDALRDGL